MTPRTADALRGVGYVRSSRSLLIRSASVLADALADLAHHRHAAAG